MYIMNSKSLTMKYSCCMIILQTVKFLCDLSSCLALWLGVSIVTLVEFVEFISAVVVVGLGKMFCPGARIYSGGSTESNKERVESEDMELTPIET